MWLPAFTSSNYEYIDTKKEQQKEQAKSTSSFLPRPFSFRDLAIPCAACDLTWVVREIFNDSKSLDYCFPGKEFKYIFLK